MDKTHHCSVASQVGSLRIFIFQKEEEEGSRAYHQRTLKAIPRAASKGWLAVKNKIYIRRKMDKTHHCALATQVGSFRIFIFQKEEEEVESLSLQDTKS